MHRTARWLMLLLGAETIAGYLAAAAERLAEGTQLIAAGHPGGAVYLLGYVGELVIKAAVYDHFGMPPTAPIPEKTFRQIEAMMSRDVLRPRTPHDILMWAEWMVQQSKPHLTGAPYPLVVGDAIRHHAGVIDANWVPGLRYQPVAVSSGTVDAVRASAEWFVTQQANL